MRLLRLAIVLIGTLAVDVVLFLVWVSASLNENCGSVGYQEAWQCSWLRDPLWAQITIPATWVVGFGVWWYWREPRRGD